MNTFDTNDYGFATFGVTADFDVEVDADAVVSPFAGAEDAGVETGVAAADLVFFDGAAAEADFLPGFLRQNAETCLPLFALYARTHEHALFSKHADRSTPLQLLVSAAFRSPPITKTAIFSATPTINLKPVRCMVSSPELPICFPVLL